MLTPEEHERRRIDTGEWDAHAMTEKERRAKRRHQAGYAFEMMMPASRRDCFDQGTTDHLPSDSTAGDSE